MRYAKFQGNIIEWLLVQKLANMIYTPTKKKIVNVWTKNIVHYLYSQKREMCQLQRIIFYIDY